MSLLRETEDVALYDVFVALGYGGAERVSINTQLPGLKFTSQLMKVADLAGWQPPQDRNVWPGANSVGAHVAWGRGTEADVAVVHSLLCDFDVKPGKSFETYDAAWAAVWELAEWLGVQPTAVIESGHGIQPIWAVASAPGSSNVVGVDYSPDEMKQVVARFGGRALKAAHNCGAPMIDNIFELSRVFRCPQSINWKNPEATVRARAHLIPGAGRVVLRELIDRLDRDGIDPIAPVRIAGPRVLTDDAAAMEWIHAQHGAQLTLAELAKLPEHEWIHEYTDPAECFQMIAEAEPTDADPANGSHKVLVSKTFHAVMSAWEGRAGLVLSLNNLQDAYIAVHEARERGELPGDARPYPVADHEAKQAVISAVALARGRGERCEMDPDAWAERFTERTLTEDDFWSAREELTECLQFARSRRVGPWAMFGHVLVLCMSVVPPNIVLPPVVATIAGLNLFIALVGPSGAIKSGAMGAAADWLQVTPEPKLVKPGSGEGLAKCYAFIQKRQGQPAEQIGKEWSLVAHIPEVDTLNATGSRGGSTLMAELRYAWSGERLGHDYAGDDKAITLAANRYRLGMTVGVQPEKARPLFEDATGGTPQRFLWMPTDDPGAPDERPNEPLAWSLKRWPEPLSANPLFNADFDRKMKLGVPADKGEFVILAVPQQAWDEQDAHTLAKLRDPNSVDPLNGHKLLARLKVAVALMVLNGRYDKVSDDDWELAGMVMAVSDRTRESVQDKIAAEMLERNRSAGKAAAYRELAADETKAGLHDKKIRRVAGNILKVLEKLGGKAARKQVRDGIAYRDRAPYFDDAEELLISKGRISKTEIMVNGTEGHELELLSGGTDVS